MSKRRGFAGIAALMFGMMVANTALRAKAGWRPAGVSSRQPGQHVDPRGGRHIGDHADDGGVQ